MNRYIDKEVKRHNANEALEHKVIEEKIEWLLEKHDNIEDVTHTPSFYKAISSLNAKDLALT